MNNFFKLLRMEILVDRADLRSMVRGISDDSFAKNNQIKDYIIIIGSADNWVWNDCELNKLNKQQLYNLYKICKKLQK